MKKVWRRCLVGLGAVVVIGTWQVPPLRVSALDVPSAPTQTHVLDQAQVIDDATEATISKTIFDYEAKTGNQIAVLTVKSLEGEDIFGYCNRVANKWGVGDVKANNGVVLCVAAEDRKLRIEVGRGLEPMLTDLQSRRIIDQKITPNFKLNDYGGGVKAGVDSIIAVIGGERLSTGASGSTQGKTALGSIFDAAPFLVFGAIYLGSFLARSKSWWAGGALGTLPGIVTAFSSVMTGLTLALAGLGLGLLLDYWLSRNYTVRRKSGAATDWWHTGGGFMSGGFGGGSGGGSSFGGGSFGGGGSSGSW